MKKVVFLALLAMAFIGCNKESKDIKDGRRNYKRYLKLSAQDPSSIKIYSEKYEVFQNGSIGWYLDIGAKNGFGTMTRKNDTIITNPGTNKILLVKDDKIDGMIDLDKYK